MNPQRCLHCGKEKLEGELYCPQCLSLISSPRPPKILIFSIIFSLSLLVLTGLLLWHKGLGDRIFSLEVLWPKPVAVVNGEKILRSNWQRRVKDVKEFWRHEYGQEIFSGEKGQIFLAQLAREILEDMITEKLIAQEARRLGISINEEEVQKEMEEILRQASGSWDKLEMKLKSDRLLKESFQNYVRHLLMWKAISSAKSPSGLAGGENINSWLVQARQKAQVEIYDLNTYPNLFQLGGCCSLPSSKSGGQKQNSPSGLLNPKLEKEAKEAALRAYKKENPGAENLTAQVINYGCHWQIDIQKDGKMVKSYIYQNGKILENF